MAPCRRVPSRLTSVVRIPKSLLIAAGVGFGFGFVAGVFTDPWWVGGIVSFVTTVAVGALIGSRPDMFVSRPDKLVFSDESAAMCHRCNTFHQAGPEGVWTCPDCMQFGCCCDCDDHDGIGDNYAPEYDEHST